MSVWLTDTLDLDRFGITPGQHKHLIIAALTEGEFVYELRRSDLINLIKGEVEKTRVSEILGLPLGSTQRYPEGWTMGVEDTIYVIQFRPQPDQQQSVTTYYKVKLDPLGCSLLYVGELFFPRSGFSSTLRTAY
jgi:hypothetical protein